MGERLSELLRHSKVRRTCGACPSQWEGTVSNGWTVYVHYRGGVLSIGLGQSLDAAVDNSMGWNEAEPAFVRVIGDEYDGVIGWPGVLRAVEDAEAAQPSPQDRKAE